MRILLVDDNPADRARVTHVLRSVWPKAEVTEITQAEQFNAVLPDGADAILTAPTTRWADALTLRELVRERHPFLSIIALGETTDWQTAVALVKGGMCDYVPKAELQRLPQILQACLDDAAHRAREAQELQDLRTSEERYRHITRLASDYAYIYRVGHDRTFHVEWISDAFMKMTGYASVAEVVAAGGWRALIHADDLPGVLTYREPLLTGQTVESDYRVMAKNGEVHWVHNLEEQIGGPHENYLSRVAGASHEITARKTAEDSLREKEERLRMALDAAHMFTWEWTPHNDAVIAAPYFQQWLGARPSTMESYLEVVHPDDSEPMREQINRAVREGVEHRQDFRFINAAGQTLWFATTSRSFYDEQSGHTRLIGVTQEITERVRMRLEREQLLELERHARVQLEAAVQRLTTIQAVTEAAVTTLELKDLLQTMLERVCTRLKGDAAAILLLSEDNQTLVVKAAYGFETAPLGAQLALGQGLLGQIAASGVPLLVNDLPKNDLSKNAAGSGLTGLLGQRTRSLIGAPLQVGGRIIGVLHTGAGRPQAFAQEDLGLLSVLADRMASAIDRARLHSEVREGRDRLQTLSRRLMDAQETERRRIARELHDETGQALTAVKINLQSLKRRSGDLLLAERLDDSITIVEESLNSIRNISHELRPSILDDLGLIAALRWYVDRQAQRAGFLPHFRAPAGEERWPTEIETACFRIVQEAITNIIRHAAASRVWVEVQQTPQEYRLVVRDDGIGFNIKAAREHAVQGHSLGLLGMQERAQLAGGQFEIKSGKKGGAELTVRFARATDGAGQLGASVNGQDVLYATRPLPLVGA